MPDEPFCDCLDSYLRSADQAFFLKYFLSSQSAILWMSALFVFANKRATRLKVLWFEKNGFCLLYKRLHQAVFELPAAGVGSASVHIDAPALATRQAAAGPHETPVSSSRWGPGNRGCGRR